jgi:Protein of unknown function (DUF4239)
MFGYYSTLFALLIIGTSLAVGGLLLVRRFIGSEELMRHHDVAGHMLAVVGTLYAVVLGLIVVASLNTFQQARLTVSQEANSLRDIFNLAAGLPDPISTNLRNNCCSYATVMVDDEWNAMDKGKSSTKAAQAVNDLWQTLIRFQPKTQGQSDLHNSLLHAIRDLGDNRHIRLTAAQPEYDSIIWTVLLLGGASVIVFTYFFGLEKLQVQILMTVIISCVLFLNLMVVALFGSPYSGDVKVASYPFVMDANDFLQEIKSAKVE